MCKYFFVLLVFITSCKINNNQLVRERYKMTSYESKALVEEKEFPTIEILDNNTFKVYKMNVVTHRGNIETKSDSIIFRINNDEKLYGVFVDHERNILRVSGLVSINTEANFGSFKRID
jgi:hypothetical protein